MKWVAVCIFFCNSFLWGALGAKPSTVLVITNVNVVDTRFGGFHPNMTVTIKDGLIAAVSKIAIISSSPHVQTINGNGRFVIPGLWDMNTHLHQAGGEIARKAMFRLYLASGVTGVRDLDTSTAADLRELSDLQPELETAQLNGDEKPSSTGIEGRRTIEDLSEIISACFSCGANTPESPTVTSQERAYNNKAESYRTEDARKVFLDISDHATWVIPSLVSTEFAATASAHRGHRAPVSLSDKGTAPKFAETTELDRNLELVREMHRTGVQFLTGTHGPSANLLPGMPMQRELELLVEGGLTPLEALQAATVNPALYMVKLDKYGQRRLHMRPT
ncbi:MAG: amidohydrolase [Acidobacteriaceae bacterium]|nr:amidohydrolase [Acidobacteriaceae bacterium]